MTTTLPHYMRRFRSIIHFHNTQELMETNECLQQNRKCIDHFSSVQQCWDVFCTTDTVQLYLAFVLANSQMQLY